MKTLKYITKDNKSPNKRPKVYFCAHPEDVKKHLAEISADILTKQPGVAIWYDDGSFRKTCTQEERELTLSEIQMFVMPITKKLLSSPNAGLEDFRFASEHKIPVLPLMQESGLETEFNRVCGNIQFLDKNSKDLTAISYDDKLQRFLQTHIVNADLEKKIRDQFCAFVFLSYRKKDRSKAKEIMKLIHSDEELKDIAIWYDEFLVAGTPFEDVIIKTMNDSDIIAFAITDNVLEEGNYVKDIEYKHARNIQPNKPIIPVEISFSEKNRNQLDKSFEGLPQCVVAESNAVTDVFKMQLKRLAITPKKNDALHLYLLGIAYMNGIFVESDPKRGAKYIKEASKIPYQKSKLFEASKQLSDMYYYGRGVEIDYLTAARHQQSYVDYLRSKQENNSDKEELIRELYWLAEICLINPFDPDDIAHNKYLDKKTALSAYREICVISDELLKDGDNLEILKFYAVSAFRLSSFLQNVFLPGMQCGYNLDSLSEALTYSEKYLNLFEMYPILRNQYQDVFFLSLSDAYINFAQLCVKYSWESGSRTTNHHKAIEAYLKAIEHEDQNFDLYPVRLMNDYYSLAILYNSLEQTEKAKEYFLNVIRVWESLPKNHVVKMDPLSPGENVTYENALGNLADIYDDEGNRSEAKKYYEKLSKYRFVPQLLLYHDVD